MNRALLEIERMRTIVIAIISALAVTAARAEDVKLYAAGVLKSALTEAAAAFKEATGNAVDAHFGSSGGFREKILLEGDAPHVFASANLEHARAVSRAGK